MLGTQVPVQLRRRPGGGSNVGPTIEEERTLTLEGDDAITSLAFEVTPREVGPWIYELKVLAPTSDSNAADNQFESEVRVVEPNSTILILAGARPANINSCEIFCFANRRFSRTSSCSRVDRAYRKRPSSS